MNRATEEEIEGFQGWSLKFTLSYIQFFEMIALRHTPPLNSTRSRARILLIFHKLKMRIFHRYYIVTDSEITNKPARSNYKLHKHLWSV